MTDNDRVFIVTIIRGQREKEFGIGIAERVDGESLWIASIYEKEISNRMALSIVCNKINHALDEGQRALVVISKFGYYQLIQTMRHRNPRLNITTRNRQIYETYSLAKDAIKRQSTIITEV
jgi:hypothetical protein